jgi:dTDP-4-dehydrorhamnose 3,5-epimerase
MIVHRTALPDVYVLEIEQIDDERGFFARLWDAGELSRHGLRADLSHVSLSFNRRKGTLRGLHYQIPPMAEAKIVRCVRGAVFDVAVDLRRSSPAFGKWSGTLLSAENKRLVWIPEGFAHGFLVLSDSADCLYETSDFYAPQHERCVLWSDPEIGIEWPLTGEVVITAKDRAGLRLREAETYP